MRIIRFAAVTPMQETQKRRPPRYHSYNGVQKYVAETANSDVYDHLDIDNFMPFTGRTTKCVCPPMVKAVSGTCPDGSCKTIRIKNQGKSQFLGGIFGTQKSREQAASSKAEARKLRAQAKLEAAKAQGEAAKALGSTGGLPTDLGAPTGSGPGTAPTSSRHAKNNTTLYVIGGVLVAAAIVGGVYWYKKTH